jgi:FKBP-type peptidyl-prolyl cis-trans isomerase
MNSNKSYIIAGIVVVLIVIGAYFYFSKSTPTTTTDILESNGNGSLVNETPKPSEVAQNSIEEIKVEPVKKLEENKIIEKKVMKDSDIVKLDIQVTQAGTGSLVSKAGDTLSMNYTGKLLNGNKFDSNVDPAFNHVQPFQFKLGAGQVIQGWDQGLVGMKVGEKRTLTIPSAMGYGARGAGSSIPPNAALVFDVELLKIN